MGGTRKVVRLALSNMGPSLAFSLKPQLKLEVTYRTRGTSAE